jgi:hypothetical protein
MILSAHWGSLEPSCSLAVRLARPTPTCTAAAALPWGSGGRGSPGTPGSQILTRPFFNVLNGEQDAEFLAGDLLGGRAGGIDIAYLQRIMGAEGNCKHVFAVNNCMRFSGLAGLRFLAVDESLDIATFGSDLPEDPPVLDGTTDRVTEFFATRNRFYGAQIGGVAEVLLGNLLLSVNGKLGLGACHQRVKIGGRTVSTDQDTGVVTTTQSGLLAQTSNSGDFSSVGFAYVPEVSFSAGYYCTENILLKVGYNFLYISDVARPGDHIDTSIDPSPGPGLLQPAFPGVQKTNFWAQGLTVGIELRY